MSAASTVLRVLAASLVASLTVTGCQALEETGRVIGRGDLVNDLAARLDGAHELTYSADYQLSGDRSVSIAQSRDPVRTAYTYPGGKISVTAEAATTCRTTGRPVCTLTLPPTPANRPSVAVFSEAEKQGMITPPAVMGLLTAAALDPDAVIEETDTSLAGHPATCVDVRSAEVTPFTACVTVEGVLGSFTGQVDGEPTELALRAIRQSVDEAAFDLPPGAGVDDRRPAR
ncbi:hypothetical protein O7606_14230 [Micromonospora sp. WMMD882]|uniref:hypothetical protein n=1 Tax=Micromonospora sp. WMMD882 TaxID=3015151 RepID=UPI00248B6B5C|nr:hypothetical protein [Micromonospora sp. WMMD882]WBB77445.1 hypothetical protein O7606_14230 [Micromonospora sp. WMMD882]